VSDKQGYPHSAVVTDDLSLQHQETLAHLHPLVFIRSYCDIKRMFNLLVVVDIFNLMKINVCRVYANKLFALFVTINQCIMHAS